MHSCEFSSGTDGNSPASVTMWPTTSSPGKWWEIHPPLGSAAVRNKSAMDSNGQGRSFTVKTASKQKTANAKLNLQTAIKHLYLCLFPEGEGKPDMPQEKTAESSWGVCWSSEEEQGHGASAGKHEKSGDHQNWESLWISWEKIAKGMLKWPQQADGV